MDMNKNVCGFCNFYEVSSHHKIQCLRENFSVEEGDKEKDSWRRYCHQTNDGLSIPLIRSGNLVFFNSEHFKNSLVLQKHA